MTEASQIKYNTRPESVKTYSDFARRQVRQTIAALAQDNEDHDQVSQIRAAEAVAALDRVLALDSVVAALDITRKAVLDSLHSQEDILKDATPSKKAKVYKTYTPPTTPKGGSTNVGSQGQAKPQGPSTPAGVHPSGAGAPNRAIPQGGASAETSHA